jgi:hypothetical protein
MCKSRALSARVAAVATETRNSARVHDATPGDTDAVHIHRGVLARVGYRWDQRANSRPGFAPPEPLSLAVVRRIRRRQFAISVVLILLSLTTALIGRSHLTNWLIVFLIVHLVFSGLSEAMLRRRKLWPNRSDGPHD